jgi:hypothetical protein
MIVIKGDCMVNRPKADPEPEPGAKNKWYIDTDTGELKREADSVADTEKNADKPQPRPMRAAEYTSD